MAYMLGTPSVLLSLKPAKVAGYSTPCMARDLLPSCSFRASKNGDPVTSPKFPGSVCPRGKTTVTSAQEAFFARSSLGVPIPALTARLCCSGVKN
jgi:hypothetical protein